MSRNTTENKFQVVYFGFDGLDVSFQGAFPPEFLLKLGAAKIEAQEKKQPSVVTVPNSDIQLQVAESGAPGGFRYRFDTGPEGEVWFVKESVKLHDWNIRVSVKSAALAAHGYHGIKKRLYDRLEAMGASVLNESIGRVDFAIDFRADDFELDPETIISHAKTTRSLHGTREQEEFSYVMAGRKFSGVTIGKMPGAQLIIYDKSREVIKKQKDEWWQIWGIEKQGFTGKVWRKELRAGKKYLKEVWNISSWQSLEDAIGDLYMHMMKRTRMAIRNPQDSNVTRWETHPMWLKAQEIVKDVFAQNINGNVPGRIIVARRERVMDTYRDMICGLAASYACVSGLSAASVERVVERIRADLIAFMKGNRDKVDRNFVRAMDRYVFILEGGGIEHATDFSA